MLLNSSFCPDELWDQITFWNTANPTLTQCFTDTILPSIPCGFLWLATPYWYARTYFTNKKDLQKSDNKFETKLTPLFWAKLVFTLILIINIILQFVSRLYLHSDSSLYPSELYHTFLLLATYILVILLIILDKKWDIHASFPLFEFDILLLISSISIFKDQIEDLINEENKLASEIIIAATYFPIIVIHLILFSFADHNQKVKPQSPLAENASPPSYLSFSFMAPMIWRGFKKPVTFDNLPQIPKTLNTTKNAVEFMSRWTHKLKKGNISFTSDAPPAKKGKLKANLWPVLLDKYGLHYLYASLIGLIHFILQFVNPIILDFLIEHVSSDEETWKGIFYALILFASNVVSTITYHHMLSHTDQVAIKARNSVISAIYRKSLKISNKARQSFTVGEITNFMSIDAQRVFEVLPQFHNCWSTPLTIAVSLYLLYVELGVAIFPGILVLIFVSPINIWASKKAETLQTSQLEAKDSRIKNMNEILSSMKILKLYAWENPFMKKIKEIRDKEISILKYTAYVWGATNVGFAIGPFGLTLTTFGVYVAMDPLNNVLTANKIFVSLSLFNIMRLPLTFLPWAIVEGIKLFVSINRINKFMNAEELDDKCIGNYPKDKKNAIEVKDATFSWSSNNEEPTLKDVDLNVKKGSLVAVVGVVGAGKSSLLSSLLGEIEMTSGSVDIDGSIAYVPQQAWIQNMSLQNNILFDKEYNEKRYENILDACALRADLEILDNADETEIGENGINLSGGQKQRVSLARAVYSDSDIVLLDDPLSAVDAHVGKHIFEHVLSSETGVLKNKTRVLVTHGIHFLDKVDKIIVIRDGEIKESGSFEELMNNKGAFAEFLMQYLNNENGKEGETDAEIENKVREETDIDSMSDIDQSNLKLAMFKRQISEKEGYENKGFEVTEEKDDPDYINPQRQNTKQGQLTEEEYAMVGNVSIQVYLHYLRNIGYPFVFLVLSFNVLGQGSHALNNLLLSQWADLNTENISAGNQDTAIYLGAYSGIGLFEVIMESTRELTLFLCCARASRIIHEKLLYSIMRSPMSFFDTNPIGRIMNRFSSDIDTIDQVIPFILTDMFWCLVESIFTILIISVATPEFIGVVIPLFVIYVFIQQYYIATNRQLKRLDSITKSPIFAHFSETINGAVSIRAYKQQNRFVSESENKVYKNVQCYYHVVMANRWLGLRIEFLGVTIILAASLLAVFSRDTLSAGLAGLSISYSMQIVEILNWLVLKFCDLETNCVAIERVLEYSNNEHEAEWDKDDVTLPKEWPSKGKIVLHDYQTRYRKGLDLVLKGLSMQINSTEKVGIVGRTGAGKSSLTLALFRIIEPASGKIIIDKVDITELGLHQLRSKLTIIPQDPVLFSGTLRFNLDPTNQYTDSEVWSALELAHLKKHVTDNLPDGLNHEVSEQGQNFSVGQQQLICLARAILRKTKILILDEATAAVDLETDDLIQATIRKEFSNCTIITIAHRINTIMDSDRVAVLSDGKLVEYDSPNRLLKNDESVFKSLAENAGISS